MIRISAILLCVSCMFLVACENESDQVVADRSDTTTSESPPAQSEPQSADAPVTPAMPDYSGEWWWKTYGDNAVLSAESDLYLGLNPQALNRDERLEATFKSIAGQATLKVSLSSANGDQEETVQLEQQAYLDLWQEVIGTGFLGIAMKGIDPGWSGGTGVYIGGHAGPDGLGWTISSTYESFQSVSESRRLIEVLDQAAREASAIYRDNR